MSYGAHVFVVARLGRADGVEQDGRWLGQDDMAVVGPRQIGAAEQQPNEMRGVLNLRLTELAYKHGKHGFLLQEQQLHVFTACRIARAVGDFRSWWSILPFLYGANQHVPGSQSGVVLGRH